MSRRLSGLTAFLLLLFVVVAVQAVNIQWRRAPALDSSSQNPRLASVAKEYPRGEIFAANGAVLAQSEPSGNSLYPWKREYPLGSLTANEVGIWSSGYIWGLEEEYNSYLQPHTQTAHSLSQLLAPTAAADSITLTLQPALQKIAETALDGRNGSVVALNPKTGAVLAMYSNPSFDPSPFSTVNFTTQEAAWKKDTTPDSEGFPPLGLVATQQTFPPGSTFKVITTASAVVYRPDLLIKEYPKVAFISLPNSPKKLFNDGGVACGGNVTVMLPASCDPGYASLGLDLGAENLTTSALSFGYNEVPPLDFPNVVSSSFPDEAYLAANPAYLAYSAIGQEDVRASALQNALVAAAVANGGKEMVPHFLNYVSASDGSIVTRFKDRVWKTPLTSDQASQIVPLMQDVVHYGTAAGIFLSQDDVAAKTGTAQVGNSAKNTDDWMIAFAPATDPVVAVAVSVPYQETSVTGAEVAGPIMKCVIEGALALHDGVAPTGTSTTCSG